jgi:hypothetical protein
MGNFFKNTSGHPARRIHAGKKQTKLVFGAEQKLKAFRTFLFRKITLFDF